jgi:phospho-N-acetylmuramoyl-pentapeptide-transferase
MPSTELASVFIITTLAFILAFFVTPIFTAFLFQNRLGKQIRNDGTTPIFTKLHSEKAGTPTMGGILVWGTVLILIALFWFLHKVLHLNYYQDLDFFSRKETLLPLGAFLGASLVGLIDDWLDVRKKGYLGRGIRFRHKIWLYTLVAAIGAWWFYFKLGFTAIDIPFWRSLDLGIWFIPLFTLIVMGTSFAVNQTDGLDGLAGGVLLLSFLSFGLIAYFEGKFDLAKFICAVSGSLLAFLWYNVYPARFFMGDTGSMGMGVLLAIVAFLTNGILLLPIIGFIFVLEAFSTVLQILSKKLFHKKIFLVSPIHHHFQAKGWPETKVTMRFWIISALGSIIGLIIYFIK